MGAKCVPESNTYEQVMQINTVKCSAAVSLPENNTVNEIGESRPLKKSKGRSSVGNGGPIGNGHVENGTAINGAIPNGVVANGSLPNGTLPNGTLPNGTLPAEGVSQNGVEEVKSNGVLQGAETQNISGSNSRKPSFKANGSSKNGDSLSSFRSTSTMSSGSIASNISQLCEKYFIQPLIRSRSLPTNMPHNNTSTRSMPYIHLRRRKGKCLKKFCMRFLPPAAACSGVVACQLTIVADRNLGKPTPGDGTKPVFPLGFSKGNPGLELRSGMPPVCNGANTAKLKELSDATRQEAVEKPPYNFFICHTEEDYIPYVDKLVKKCEKEDISIFSRSYSLLWGDSQRVDTQLAISSALFGIVLLSPALLNSYRSSWCEKDLDVLFDRNTSPNGCHSVILPIYCGGITHEQVQGKYPFLTIQSRLIYEDQKIDGIVKQMKLVLEKRKSRPVMQQIRTSVTSCQREETRGTVSELDIVCEMDSSQLGVVCAGPETSNGGEKVNGATNKTPSTIAVHRPEPLYKTNGVINHCGHCGPMSSKYRGAVTCTQSDLDREAELMEKIHQARIAGDSESEDEDRDEDLIDDDEKILRDPAKLNDLLPTPLSSLSYEVLKLLSIMMDPITVVGNDFTSFAAQIGFCSTYIRYLKALDIKKNSPFEEVLAIWQDSVPDTTIGDLMYLLNEIRRKDVVYKLNEYYPVLPEQ